jgi:thiol:disulfide interchange protein DsbC
MRIRTICILTALVALSAASIGGALALHAGTQPADSPEAQAKQALTAYLTGRAEVGEVRPSQLPGLFEAVVGTDLFYTDRTGRYILTGDLIDTKQRVNLSDARRATMERIDWAALPFDLALKTKHGNGQRSLAVFADPNCGYCKRLEGELAKLDNLTVYTFVFPLLSADSAAKASAILCAPNPAGAWRDWMSDGKAPAANAACADKVTRLLEIGRGYHVRGTPLLVFQDGSQIKGLADAAAIEQKLAAVKS